MMIACFEVIKYVFDKTLLIDQKANTVNTVVFLTHIETPLEIR